MDQFPITQTKLKLHMRHSFLFFSSLLLLVGALQPIDGFSDVQKGEPENDEIVVKLSTDSSLSPIYIAEFSTSNVPFDKHYLNQLRKVLEFDLNFNGRTQVVAQTNERQALVQKEMDKNSINAAAWKNLNVLYVLKPHIEGKKLSIRMYSVNPPTFNESKDYVLHGSLDSDRQTIHKLSDRILHQLFHEEGIATTHILYTIKTKNSDPLSKSKSIAEVWEADYDGANARQVTHEGRLCVTPSYLPPKSGHAPGSFFYVCYRAGQPKIYLASLKDGIGHPFTTLKGNQLMPMASPKRDCVAFISDVAGNPDLFLQPFNPETRQTEIPRQIFAALKGVQGSPSFSPDGKQIAFVSNKDGSPRIYIMEIPPVGMPLKEIKTTMISKKNKENTSPSWSPDGTMLAYSSMNQGVRQIVIYELSSRQERQLTQGLGHKENPSWAPNSLHLVFNSDSPEAGYSQLYVVNLNSNEAKKITAGNGEKRFPSWEPRSH
jgi:TolB protein